MQECFAARRSTRGLQGFAYHPRLILQSIVIKHQGNIRRKVVIPEPSTTGIGHAGPFRTPLPPIPAPTVGEAFEIQGLTLRLTGDVNKTD